MVHGISLPALAQRPSRTEPVVFVFDSYFPGALMEFRHVCFREWLGMDESGKNGKDMERPDSVDETTQDVKDLRREAGCTTAI